jgi:uncharacterized protein (DUF488 family)
MQTIDKQLFTIGHGSRGADEFIHLLKKYSIEVVVDVRTYPNSRFNPQFRKEQFAADLKSSGIEYLYLGEELGGRPKDKNFYYDGKANYKAIKQTKLFQSGITQVEELIRDGIKVTLVCSEADQNQCHRKHMIADEFSIQGIDVFHINKIGRLEKHIHAEDLSLFD